MCLGVQPHSAMQDLEPSFAMTSGHCTAALSSTECSAAGCLTCVCSLHHLTVSAACARRTRSIGRAVSRQSSHGGMKRQGSSILSRAASIAGFGDDYGGDCGICLDEAEEVAINGCNHRLCVDCSISLCEVHKKPPLCPFCRGMISGFHEMPKGKYYVG